MPTVSRFRLEAVERWAQSELFPLLRTWFGETAGITVAPIGRHELFAEEEALMQAAVPARRDEFSTGRWCAREALKALGVAPAPMGMGARREPLWPAGMLGSITHAGGVCAAVVLPASECHGVGIDLVDEEEAKILLLDAAAFVATSGEDIEARESLPAFVDSRTLLFSAKECVIKAISARAERFIDFTEIRIRFLGLDAFEASLAGARLPVCGWCRRSGGFFVTGAGLSVI